MPYKSAAQRRFFHTDTARKAGITPAMTAEWDAASKGQHLSEHARDKAPLKGFAYARRATKG